jgi:hypothetical protein
LQRQPKIAAQAPTTIASAIAEVQAAAPAEKQPETVQ